MKKEKINDLLKQANRELTKFKKSIPKYPDWNIHLVQASEKIWSAYVLMLEYISKKEIETAEDIWKIKNQLKGRIRNLDNLHSKARLLHVYHYEGKTPNIEIYETVRYCIKYIRKILRR